VSEVSHATGLGALVRTTRPKRAAYLHIALGLIVIAGLFLAFALSRSGRRAAPKMVVGALVMSGFATWSYSSWRRLGTVIVRVQTAR
jgi:hypothetical protein